MITPVINNFIDKKHLIYYDINNLELLKKDLLYYLNNNNLIDKISENGYLHALIRPRFKMSHYYIYTYISSR